MSLQKWSLVIFVLLVCIILIPKSSNMLIIGHRGASGYEPENTLRSFKRAVDMGAGMIELDVYVCKTGELVVMHDDEVDRMTNGHGHVVDMTFDQLRNLVVEGKEKIPTLQEVIDVVDRRIPINIELKGSGTVVSVAQLVQQYIAKGWNPDRFIVSSFDHEQVQQFKRLCPTIKTGVLFLWAKMPESIVSIAQEYHANFIGLDAKAVTGDLVKTIHDAGLQVYVWTVNDKQTADKMRTYKVDGIFSNYPDRV